jgi:hypothetical protein
MWHWHLVIDGLLLVTVVGAAIYAFRLRKKQESSKASFALAIAAILVSYWTGFAKFVLTPDKSILAKLLTVMFSSSTGWSVPSDAEQPISWILALIAAIVICVLSFLTVTLATETVKHWNGPTTLLVNELAKDERDNQILSLAKEELLRLYRRRPDPPVSDVAVDWRQKIVPPPNALPWHTLARQLFEVAFSEAIITDTGWRDRWYVWVGSMYVSGTSPDASLPLLLFVFDDLPTHQDIASRLGSYQADGGTVSPARIFVVFDADTKSQDTKTVVNGITIEQLSPATLIRTNLKLRTYARELVRRFDQDRLGGTDVALKDTFVECHIQRPDIKDRIALIKVISDWVADKSRRHLTITGDFGRGKSTAMLDLCVTWARRYLNDEATVERIPLLIELRGQNPGETDPITFLSGWANRYGLLSKQVLNLIQAGEAIVIFEGFDELHHAGRAYDRHQHFNSLWRMAYPGTK